MRRVANPDRSLDEGIKRGEPVLVLFNSAVETSFDWQYQVTFYGIIKDGRKISVTFEDIRPYIHIRVPPGVDPEELKRSVASESGLNYYQTKDISITIERGKRAKLFELDEVNYMKMAFGGPNSRGKVLKRLCPYGGCVKPVLVGNDLYTLDVASNREPLLMFICDHEIDPAGLMKIDNYRIDTENKYNKDLSFGLIVGKSGEKFAATKVDIGSDKIRYADYIRDKTLIMCFDIETYSNNPYGLVPAVNNKDDDVFMASCVFVWNHTDEPFRTVTVTTLPVVEKKLKKGEMYMKHEVYYASNEKILLRRFIEVISEMKPDIVLSFNGDEYDWPFLWERMKYHSEDVVMGSDEEKKQVKQRNLIARFKEKVTCLPYKYHGEEKDYAPFNFKLVNDREFEYSNFDPVDQGDKYLNSENKGIKNVPFKIDASYNAIIGMMQMSGMIDVDVRFQFMKMYNSKAYSSLNFFLKENNLGLKEDMHYTVMFDIVRALRALREHLEQIGVELPKSGGGNSGNWYDVSVNWLDKQYEAHYDELDGFIDFEVIPGLSWQKVRDMLDPTKHDSVFKIVSYCEYDSLACWKLMKKRNVITDKRSIASRAMVPMSNAFMRADTEKIMNMECLEFRKQNLFVDSSFRGAKVDYKYPGAKVIEPIKGTYMATSEVKERRIERARMLLQKYYGLDPDDIEMVLREFRQTQDYNASDDVPVNAIDVNSLYPSVMRAYGLSPENIIRDHAIADEVRKHIDPITGKPYVLKNIKFPYGDTMVDSFVVISVLPDGTRRGVFCRMLDDLANDRITVKKQMAPYEHAREVMGKMFSDNVYKTTIKHNFQCEILQERWSGVNVRMDINTIEELVKSIHDHDKLSNVERLDVRDEILQEKWSRIYPQIDMNETKDLVLRCILVCMSAKNFQRRNPHGTEEEFKANVKDRNKDLTVDIYELACIYLEVESELEQPNAQVELRYVKNYIKWNKETYQNILDSPKITIKQKKNVERKMEDLEKFEKFFIDAFTNPESIYACDQSSLVAFCDSVDFYFNYYNSKQLAIKVFMNTMYGATGYQVSALFMVEIAGATTTFGRATLEKIVDTLETGKYRVIYGDTDSAYIMPPAALFTEVKAAYMSGALTKEEYWTEMIEISMEDGVKTVKVINDMLAKFTDSTNLKVAFEETLYPVMFLGKKKYVGIQHTTMVNLAACMTKTIDAFLKCRNVFVRGLELKKKNSSGLLRILSNEILFNAFRIDNERTMTEIVFDLLTDLPNRKFDYTMFVKTTKYKKAVGLSVKGKPKTGNVTALRFVERMAMIKAMYPQFGIEPPKYGDVIQYVIKKAPEFSYDMKGRRSATKVGDKWEFVTSFENKEYAECMQLEVDIAHYVMQEIMAVLARFSSYDPIFSAREIAADAAADFGFLNENGKRYDDKGREADDDVDGEVVVADADAVLEEEGKEEYRKKDEAAQKRAKKFLTKLYLQHRAAPTDRQNTYKAYYKQAAAAIEMAGASPLAIKTLEFAYDYDEINKYTAAVRARCRAKKYTQADYVVASLRSVLNMNMKDCLQYLTQGGRIQKWAREYQDYQQRAENSLRMSYAMARNKIISILGMFENTILGDRDAGDGELIIEKYEHMSYIVDELDDPVIHRFAYDKMMYEGYTDAATYLAQVCLRIKDKNSHSFKGVLMDTKDEIIAGVAAMDGEPRPFDQTGMISHLEDLMY